MYASLSSTLPLKSLRLLVLSLSAALMVAAGSNTAWAAGETTKSAKTPVTQKATNTQKAANKQKATSAQKTQKTAKTQKAKLVRSDARGQRPTPKAVRTSLKKSPSATKDSKSSKVAAKGGKKKPVRRVRRAGMSPSQATLAGLRKTEDPLHLGSSVAYVLDQDTGEELFAKNAGVPLPIASVTKLMTALVIAESGLPLREKVRITREDYVRSTASSKMRSGMVLTREALLKAALMSSDNRAASALARSYPGGRRAFIAKMNEQAEKLGMADSFFADPTGLDNRNHSTARDLGRLVSAVHQHKILRDSSTPAFASISTGRRMVNLSTTNRLIGDPTWKIGVQKTGFTTAAGRCMVVQSDVGDRHLVMVVLDSPDNARRAADMRTMRAYVAAEDAFTKDFEKIQPYAIF